MKAIALFESTGKPEVIKWVRYTAIKLHRLGARVYVSPELVEKIHQFDFDSVEIDNNVDDKNESFDFLSFCEKEDLGRIADVLISFGGDGTMLAAARLILKFEVPILGVNIGKLGFLAEVKVSQIDYAIRYLMEGHYRIVQRTVLETTINNEILYAINDIVIEKKNSSRMITLQAFSNQTHIGDYRADGLIVTTPTGSTAYSLSCGGPILAPNASVLCITPISPHSLTLRPLVVPDSVEIKLIIDSPTGEVNLVSDGQTQLTLKSNDEVIIRKSEYEIKLIKPIDSSYFDLLRNKLLWATDAIDKDKK